MKKPELPKSFADNLEQIATELHGRRVDADFGAEWKISDSNVKLLLEYMDAIGLIAVAWVPEQQCYCFVKKNHTLN